MRSSKCIWKVIRGVLLFGVFSLMFLLIGSASWFLNNFHEVEISTALYQIVSPLKGTETGVLNSYINQCLYPSLSLAVFCVVVYTLYDMIAGNLLLDINIRIGSGNLCLQIGKSRFARPAKVIVLWAVLVILSVGVFNRAEAVGLPEYVRNIMEVSTIFETEYVDSDEVVVTFPENRRNLIVIYMESMEATYASTKEGGGKPNDYIPELAELAEANLYFSNDGDLGGARGVTGTGWTMGGLFASSTGVPYKLPIDGNNAGEYESFAPGLKGLGEVLEANGYQNYFMCGSESVFGGRRAFYEQHGNYEILDYNTAKKAGIIPEDYLVFWGMEDEKLYQYAKQELTRIAGQDAPFNFTMLTADTHPSDGYLCALCGNQYSKQYENVVACASKQAAQFVEWISEQEWYENTTIVITGDHLNMKKDFWDDIGDYQRRIYNCFINLPEGLSASRTTNREFTVLDMFPTILTAVGAKIEGDRMGLGVNLFSDQETLPERMGFEVFHEELKLNSVYYSKNFIMGNKK